VQNARITTYLLLRRCRMVTHLLVLGAAMLPGLAWSASKSCEDAARVAAAEHSVPTELMQAIALAETGRRNNGALRPWPWAVNEGGKGQWFDTRAEAETHAQAALDAGVRNIDIGCFQLNHRWHAQAFRSVSDMFDPLRNARHAAAFLAELYRETGDWRLAAGAYHSRTPDRADLYAARVDRLRAGVPDDPAGPVRRPAVNTFPLLQAGGAGSAGSLVPGLASARPLLTGAPARLIGG